MHKETKYQNNGSVKLVILNILVWLIYVAIQAILVIMTLNNPIFPIFINILIFFNVYVFIYYIIVLSGVVKGKIAVRKKNKYLKKINPYIYFRELPNFFGIGVTTLLIDSTIENDKDIVAAILDLCAKKYLNLEKKGDRYIVKVLKGIDDSLLSNEKYILSLVLNNDIKNINYKEWFNYCMQDGMNLGLYTHIIHKNKLDNSTPFSKEKKSRKVNFMLIPCFISIFVLIINLNNLILSTITILIFLLGILYFIFALVRGIILFFKELFKKPMYDRNQNYLDQLNNELTKTDKGVNELHKLYSFKAFIKDFGHFVDKKPEEVVLWDRYLSYAQVFGLTKEIMESGYKELIDNSSFRIDDINNINNINLYNIDLQEYKKEEEIEAINL